MKSYHDTHGHQAGDEPLATAVSAWREVLRDVDLLARWGGEEFVVQLPGAGSSDASGTIERVRGATPFEQTCSAGIAEWDGCR